MIQLDQNQIRLHWAFGVQLDYRHIKNSAHVKELVQQHGLVVLNDVEFSTDRDKFYQFIETLGQPTHPVVASKIEGYSIPIFDNTPMGVEEWIRDTRAGLDNTGIHDLLQRGSTSDAWHQDSVFYSYNRTMTCATLDLTDLPPGEKTCDTAFSSVKEAFRQFSPRMQDLLRTLTVKHSYKRQNLVDSMISTVVLNYLGQKSNEEILQIVQEIKSRMPPATEQSLVQTSPWGFEYLTFSLNADIEFLELTQEESQFMVDFIAQQLLKQEYAYSHRWKPNQILIWDNQSLMHSMVRNATVESTRKLWRSQILI